MAFAKLMTRLKGLWVLLLFVSFAAWPTVPALTGPVVDEAQLFSPQFRQQLSEKLLGFEQTQGVQMAVLTVNALDGRSIEEYSMEVAESWQLGQKGSDNGVLMIIAPRDRKMRIEVGRGLEGNLTDLVAGRIVDRIMRPLFKQGQMEDGVLQGVDATFKILAGEEVKALKKNNRRTAEHTNNMLPILIFAWIILAAVGRALKPLTMGVTGAVAAPAVAFLGWGLNPLVFIPLGFIIGLLLSFSTKLSTRSSSRSGGWGGFSGGGFSGGGFSGGGFSGGGGSFSGGGSSGSW